MDTIQVFPPQAVREQLSAVLAWSAHDRWWGTPIPEFNDATPEQVWKLGPVGQAKVFTLVESYGRDQAFT